MDVDRRLPTANRARRTNGAAPLVACAGLLYLQLAQVHWERSAGLGLLFAGAGVVQLGWGFVGVRKPSRVGYAASIVVSGGTLTLSLLTLAFSTPVPLLSSDTRVLKGGAAALQALALLAAIGLLIVEGGARPLTQPGVRLLGVPLVVGIAAGGFLYGAMAPLDHTADAHAAAVAQASAPDTIDLVIAGIARPLSAGSDIPIAGDVIGRIAIDRGAGDGRYQRTLDLALVRIAEGEQPLDGATVQLTARMRYMDHGTFREVATQSGGGHYVLPLHFPMPGEWELQLDISVPGLPAQTLVVDIDLID